MAREAKIQIFQGTTPKPTRDYLQLLFADLRERYERLYVPCAGRFTVPQVARAAGWEPGRIIASDISLYSSILGYLTAGRDLEELQITFGPALQHLERYRGTDEFAAACLYGMKWAQYAAGKSYYLQSFKSELESNVEGYIAAFRARLIQLCTALGKIDYRTADLFAEMAECEADRDAIIYINPPAYKAGYTKMFEPVFQHMTWVDPAVPEFDPKDGLQKIFDYARRAQALTIWYRVGDVTADEAPYVTFGHELKAGKVDYCLLSRPAEGEVATQSRNVTPISAGEWPAMTADHEITPDSVIRCHDVPRDIALYYRELWAHKLGVTRAERYFVFTVDGRLWAVAGMHLSDALRRRKTSTGTNVFELFGFNAPTRYKRLNTLLMLCITCDQFRDDLMAGDPLLAYVGEFGFSTTCLADVPEIKANRGILKITGRSQMPNGKYKILYNTKFHTGRYSDMVRKWLAKDARALHPEAA